MWSYCVNIRLISKARRYSDKIFLRENKNCDKIPKSKKNSLIDFLEDGGDFNARFQTENSERNHFTKIYAIRQYSTESSYWWYDKKTRYDLIDFFLLRMT